MSQQFITEHGSFSVEISEGVGTVTFQRPPVNAFRVSTYEELIALTESLETNTDVRAVVLAAGPASRCWCGGADVNDFSNMDGAGRDKRYEIVNAAIPRFASLEKPVVAAISGHTIGIGVMLAAVCDIRIAADTAEFATPEVNYGLIAGTSRLLNYLGVPEGLVRELAFTGRRATADEMKQAGFVTHVVAKNAVIERATSLARVIATKGAEILSTRKRIFVEHEMMSWFDAYQHAQRASSTLVGSEDARAGVDAFLNKSLSS